MPGGDAGAVAPCLSASIPAAVVPSLVLAAGAVCGDSIAGAVVCGMCPPPGDAALVAGEEGQAPYECGLAMEGAGAPVVKGRERSCCEGQREELIMEVFHCQADIRDKTEWELRRRLVQAIMDSLVSL